MPRRLIAGAALACALLCALILPLTAALAADIATVGDKAVIPPLGDWIVAIAQTGLVAATPVLVALIMTWLGTLVPWLRLFISERMVRRLVENSRDLGAC